MALLEPELAILDETDSGLDIDALKTIAKGINKLRRQREFNYSGDTLSEDFGLHRT